MVPHAVVRTMSHVCMRGPQSRCDVGCSRNRGKVSQKVDFRVVCTALVLYKLISASNQSSALSPVFQQLAPGHLLAPSRELILNAKAPPSEDRPRRSSEGGAFALWSPQHACPSPSSSALKSAEQAMSLLAPHVSAHIQLAASTCSNGARFAFQNEAPAPATKPGRSDECAR